MLGSMEPDPIAGFMHVTNIVIIPSGLRKCCALEWLQIISRSSCERLVILMVIYEWRSICQGDCISVWVMVSWLINTWSMSMSCWISWGNCQYCVALWWELFMSYRAAFQKVSRTPACILWSESSWFNGLMKMGSENWDKEVSRLYTISRETWGGLKW